jgi:hypothetical protein
MSDTKKQASAAADPKNDKEGKKDEEKKIELVPEEELTEEDALLKEKLGLLVERLSDKDAPQRDNALTQIKDEI